MYSMRIYLSRNNPLHFQYKKNKNEYIKYL